MALESILSSVSDGASVVQKFTQDYCQHAEQALQELIENSLLAKPERSLQLCKLLRCSQYAYTEIVRRPERLKSLLKDLKLEDTLNKQDLKTLLFSSAETRAPDEGNEDESHFYRRLRNARNIAMLRIIWRDLNRLADLWQTTEELSNLAEISLQAALDYHYPKLTERLGTPRNKQGEEQPFLILGMGKLGAHELNLSSDIDLIFCFPERGHTDSDKQIDNQEFFSRLGKKVIQSLDNITADGFVFRVDMRLRPYGQSGALVSNFSALEEYYQTQGREWERYAMVKARVVAQSQISGNHHSKPEETLMAMLRSFTYRKYIDFSVIDALRGLKEMIKQEVRRRKIDDDIKLGAGGIREIEFTAQVFQLIRGGRDTELQDSRIKRVLPLLEQLQCLPEGKSARLLEAYTFLRNTEHAIQAYADEQTQKLPSTEQAQTAICVAMSYANWECFLEALNRHREIVQSAFDKVIASKEDKSEQSRPEQMEAHLLWQQVCMAESSSHDSELYAPLFDFAHEAPIQHLIKDSRSRLDHFMPLLLSQITHYHQPVRILNRVLPLIRSVVRRSAYLVLLIENPQALQQLLSLLETSQQIADQLSKYPALLDELLDPTSLYSLPQKTDLVNELQQCTLRIEESDLEQQMETLRYFKLSHSLRIAACEVSGALPLMKVSDYLTVLAEAILDYCLNLVWNTMIARHGYPAGVPRDKPDFLIVGYGKLGGIEMNHGSDLDLVFIHDADVNGETDGNKPIDNGTFYVRLGQKLIHLLNTQTASGRLYEVDMRLRPSGNSGLLASTFSAFSRYQENEAWTWEHQALVRARAISGDPTLAERFNAVRRQILMKPRQLSTLKNDIVEMRKKMREHLGTKAKESDKFHLKQDAGGIVDIEFMVQYLVLAWSHAEPSLAIYTDNIRILEALAHTDKLSTQEVEQLIAAYKALRVVLHRLTIEQKSSHVSSDTLESERDSVRTIWQRLLGDGTGA